MKQKIDFQRLRQRADEAARTDDVTFLNELMLMIHYAKTDPEGFLEEYPNYAI